MSGSSQWWTFHGDSQRTGCVSGSDISAANVKDLATAYTLQVGGPVMSVPAVVDGFVYVGVANFSSSEKDGADGGAFHKISLETGETVASYTWPRNAAKAIPTGSPAWVVLQR